jgi:hypothetical protein
MRSMRNDTNVVMFSSRKAQCGDVLRQASLRAKPSGAVKGLKAQGSKLKAQKESFFLTLGTLAQTLAQTGVIGFVD